MDSEREFGRAIEIGQSNQETLELLQNWCSCLSVEPWGGGVGLVEQVTGLPIGMRRIRCPHARAAGIAGMVLEDVALDFYERNCRTCTQRVPVRLPNILKIVEKHESDSKRRVHAVEQSAQRAAHRRAGRLQRRRLLRQGGNPSRDGVFDILDRLDESSSEVESRCLIETALAAPGEFDAGVQEALFDLVEDGGWIPSESALTVLFRLGSDPKRLTEAALRAIARDEATEPAAAIVTKWPECEKQDLIIAAIPALICLACPTQTLALGGEIEDKPESLIALYRLYPRLVLDAVRGLLQHSDKRYRISAAGVIEMLIYSDPQIGLDMAPHLIRSISLPDDSYDEGPAAGAAIRALVATFAGNHVSTDRLLQEALTSADHEEGGVLFSTYTRFLDESGDIVLSPSPAQTLAMQRIVDAIAERRSDKSFEQALWFFRDRAAYYPTLLESHAETFIGAVALIADDLENPYSPLLDPRPSTLKALEAHTRSMLLTNALHAVAEALGTAALRRPTLIGGKILEAIAGLGESHDRARGALLRSLGIMGRRPEGLAIALPELYSGMLDQSVLVRAAAARAYAQVTERDPEALPSLFHESFLLLLSDSYVAVHRAAVHALKTARLPEPYRPIALAGFMNLIQVYSATHTDDRFLSECIERFLDFAKPNEETRSAATTAVLRFVPSMSSEGQADFLRHQGWRFRGLQAYHDLIVRALSSANLNEYILEDLMGELSEVPDMEIRRLSHAIRLAAAACARHGHRVTDEFVDVLTIAGAHASAADTARDAADRFGDSRWDRPRKLRARARLIAAKMELAMEKGNVPEVVRCTKEWRQNKAEIAQDDEESKTK